MTKKFIRLGDMHSHGGVVTTASATMRIHGRNLARQYDKVTCPIHGDNYIDEGDATMIVDGRPVALEGHKTACGAVLRASQTSSGRGTHGTASRAGAAAAMKPSELDMAKAAYGDPRYWMATTGAPAPGTATPNSSYGEPSGPGWVARYPTSTSLSDLVQPFQEHARKFISALEDGGANVTINATLRPAERAYLMHYSYLIAQGADPAAVPPQDGVTIDWAHRSATGQPNPAEAQAGAQAMVDGYDIAYPPALSSRHTEGRAMDISISDYAGKSFVDGSGATVRVNSPHDLETLGRSFGVFKLASDPPHWSDDGH